MGTRTAKRSGRTRKGELQSVARAIRRSGATAGPNAGRGADAVLACSFATMWCNRARWMGCAHSGDDIDRKWGGRRHWAVFSARDKVSNLTWARRAGQWRQKLGLVDFRDDRAFWREVAAKRSEQRIVQE